MANTSTIRNIPSTSSFVAEVLASTGKRDKEDISATLEKFAVRIDQVKAEGYDALQKKYVDFFPNLDSAVELNARADALSEEMHELTCKIEGEVKNQLNLSATEFENLAVQLRESKLMMDMLGKLMKIEETLSETEAALSNREYVKAVSNQSAVNQILQQPVHEREKEIQALVILDKEFQHLQSKLQDCLSESWLESVSWSLPAKKNKSPKNEGFLKILQIKRSGDAQESLVNTIQALDMLDLLDKKLNAFGDQVFEHILKPLVSMNGVAITTANDGSLITLGIKYTPANQDKEKLPSPDDVFNKLQVVMSFLNDHLMNVPMVASEDSQTTMMERYGQLTCDKYLKFITENFLVHSIPTSSRDLENYDNVTSLVSSFQEELLRLKYLHKDNQILSDFIANTNLLFANKKTQEILMRARSLMKSDIHNTVIVGGSKSLDIKPLGLEGSSNKKRKITEKFSCSNKLSQNTFRFPECHISEYVVKMMELCYETLEEAASSPDNCSVQLFYTTRDLFELFCDVVPTYHKQSLATLPQLAGLHHNNCMYIAHQLLTLGHLVSPHLPDYITATYVDLVPRFRQLGTQCFMDMMSQQKSQMLDSLSLGQAFQNLSEEENKERAELAVKQVLHQLRHLSAVWKDILPSNIFCKAMGTLVNASIVEVVDSVVALVDISEDDSNEIHAIISILVNQSPKLFADTPEARESTCEAIITKRVAKWGKLKELLVIQSASLQEIVDRWADGKGPLAHHFKANEVKQVIRAIFQNTDRRSNVLAKIR